MHAGQNWAVRGDGVKKEAGMLPNSDAEHMQHFYYHA